MCTASMEKEIEDIKTSLLTIIEECHITLEKVERIEDKLKIVQGAVFGSQSNCSKTGMKGQTESRKHAENRHYHSDDWFLNKKRKLFMDYPTGKPQQSDESFSLDRTPEKISGASHD